MPAPTWTGRPSVNDYADYTDAYDQLYDECYGGHLAYYSELPRFDAGNHHQPAAVHHRHRPLQEDEPGAALRFAGGQAVPGDRRRLLPAQTNHIHQDYKVDDLAPDLSVNGFPGTLWLTQQKRVDKDYALFGEASYDITPQITLTGGRPLYKLRQYADRLLRLRPQPGHGDCSYVGDTAVRTPTG